MSQGDVAVWGDILIRAWDSPAGAGGRFCGDVAVPQGQEGVHVFDISDPANPDPLSFVSLPCGTHTLTLVPDTANGRVLIYSSASSTAAGCRGLSIVDVPLANPGMASFLRFEPSGTPLVGQPNRVIVDAPSGRGRHVRRKRSGVASRSDGRRRPRKHRARERRQRQPDAGLQPAGRLPRRRDALVDRGSPPAPAPTCGFLPKAQNAEAAGAVAVIIVNNVAGAPTAMGGDSHEQLIPTAMISLADGTALKAALPSTGKVVRAPGFGQLPVRHLGGRLQRPDESLRVRLRRSARQRPPDQPERDPRGGDWSTYWYNGRIYQSDMRRASSSGASTTRASTRSCGLRT